MTYQRHSQAGSGKRTVVDAAPRSTSTLVTAGSSYVTARSARCVRAGDDSAVRSTVTAKLALLRPSAVSRMRRHAAAGDVGSVSKGTSNVNGPDLATVSAGDSHSSSSLSPRRQFVSVKR